MEKRKRATFGLTRKNFPYKFYQYWINSSDEDAKNYIKIFTLKTKGEIDELIKEHDINPGLRLLQKELAKSITIMVHGEENFVAAQEASTILFKKGDEAVKSLKTLSDNMFMEIFEGVPQKSIAISEIESGASITEVLSSMSGFLKSNGEARRALQENSISVNKLKANIDTIINSDDLIAGQYILLQRGKKNYFVLVVN